MTDSLSTVVAVPGGVGVGVRAATTGGGVGLLKERALLAAAAADSADSGVEKSEEKDGGACSSLAEGRCSVDE
jgi:hypothetical protein